MLGCLWRNNLSTEKVNSEKCSSQSAGAFFFTFFILGRLQIYLHVLEWNSKKLVEVNYE